MVEKSGADRGWEHFAHGADIGVRGFGPTPAAAFEEAARALIAVVVDPRTIAPSTAIAITCAAPTIEVLLYDWLNAIVFEMATRRMVFGDFRVRLHGNNLDGEALGEAMDRVCARGGVEVKAATFTELDVCQRPSGRWLAQCVVDV